MKKTFVIKKYMGDDAYSWAVFDKRTGRPVITGLSKREAEYYRDKREDYLQRIQNGPNHRET